VTQDTADRAYLLSREDIEVCRAFGIPSLLMRAVRDPGRLGSPRYFVARVRDVQTHFLFSGAVLSVDKLWVTLFDVYDPITGDNEGCAVDVRVVDLLTVTMNHSDAFAWPETNAETGEIPAKEPHE
jgi:hypothetical protein